MTEKTPGQVAYEQAVREFYFACDRYALWDKLSPQNQRAWDRVMDQVSARLLKRIEELEAEVARLKSENKSQYEALHSHGHYSRSNPEC